jgi:aminoglycoside/choline kinase family phosphotransferase
MKITIHKILSDLFEQWAKEAVAEMKPLLQSGSNRSYFRIAGKNKTAIGVYNSDRRENEAFLSFSDHFLQQKLNVPEIYGADIENNIYLQQDLGDSTLFSLLSSLNNEAELRNIYKAVIDKLPVFQIMGGKDLDYKKCYPRAAFDKQSMIWDLSYFKYYYLKLSNTPFDEQKLEDDFNVLTDFLLEADCNYFLYRDMQSRNIMIFNEIPYFIDYQGGRKGALQYDIASLLFDAKANLSVSLRTELLDHYIGALENHIKTDKATFLKFYYGYVLIRILQAMGAYGFRGLYEKKEHFLQSIPYAVNNLEWLLNSQLIKVNIPELSKVIRYIIEKERNKSLLKTTHKLKVTIHSFSYRHGIPRDESGNGGGYVFDCRVLHNPGKYSEYKNFTGKDKAVVDFLKSQKETGEYLSNIFAIIDKSVERYIERDFSDMMVNFGCTGGRHRSVYCAEKLSEHLKEKYQINIELRHLEKENW